MDFIYDFFKKMYDHNVILSYQGDFTQEVTKSVLSMTEKNLDSKGELSIVRRKVFNVMVESLQNIVKHSFKGDKIYDRAIFMIGEQDDNYEISTGNFLLNHEVESLKQKLDQVNNLDKAGLKALYKELIKGRDGLSNKGGAGLGLVDIARKSGQKIDYSFSEFDDSHTFFSLKTKISKNK
jgi:hypothetical protein